MALIRCKINFSYRFLSSTQTLYIQNQYNVEYIFHECYTGQIFIAISSLLNF